MSQRTYGNPARCDRMFRNWGEAAPSGEPYSLMDHPLRTLLTLLYELFLEPFLGPLQHPLGRRGNAPPIKSA